MLKIILFGFKGVCIIPSLVRVTSNVVPLSPGNTCSVCCVNDGTDVTKCLLCKNFVHSMKFSCCQDSDDVGVVICNNCLSDDDSSSCGRLTLISVYFLHSLLSTAFFVNFFLLFTYVQIKKGMEILLILSTTQYVMHPPKSRKASVSRRIP